MDSDSNYHVVRCHVIGVLEMEDDGEMDWKLIGRPTFSYKKNVIDIHNVNESFLDIIKNFLNTIKIWKAKKLKLEIGCQEIKQ